MFYIYSNNSKKPTGVRVAEGMKNSHYRYEVVINRRRRTCMDPDCGRTESSRTNQFKVSFPSRFVENGEWRIAHAHRDAKEIKQIDCQRINFIATVWRAQKPVSSGKTFFFAIDFSQVYWQIPSSKRSPEFVSFPLGPGLGNYKCRVMPFRILPALGHLESWIRYLLIQISCRAFTCIGDLQIYSQSKEMFIWWRTKSIILAM